MRKRLFRFLTAVGLGLPLVLTTAAVSSNDDSASPAVQLQLADLLYSEGRYGEALKAYDRAQASEERDWKQRALSGLVKAALRVAEFTRAMDAAELLRRRTVSEPRVMSLYGDALWAAGRFEDAERAQTDALALQPDLAEAHHGFARSLAARGELERAMEEARTALGALPREAEIHHTIGTISERLRKYEDAAVSFGNYLSLLPNRERSDKAALARTKVRFLRSFGRDVPYQLEEADEAMVHTVPFRLVKDKVLVRGRVNGGQQIEFVLDTGAEQTVLSRKAAERAGVLPIVQTLSAGVGETGLRGLQLGRIDTLEIGTLKVQNVPCLIKNPTLGGLPTKERDSISPLALGLSMTVDYQKRQLLIARHLPDEPADTVLPLRFQRLALVLGKVNTRPVNFIVDTGGEVISISDSTAANMKERPSGRRIPLKVYGISGWDRDAFLLPGIDLQFNEIEYAKFPVVVLNLRAPSALLGFQVGGIVGHRFLSKYRVTIDLDRSVLKLQKG